MKLFFRLIKKFATAAAIIWLSTAINADVTAGQELSPTPLPGVFRIHYQRADGNYSDFGLWLWDEVKKPSTDWPAGASIFSGRDKFGMFADVDLLENSAQIGFLILNIKNGEKVSESKTVRIGDKREVWVIEGDDNVYDSPELSLKPEIRLASVLAPGRLKLLFNQAKDLTENSLQKSLQLKDRHGKVVAVTAVESSATGTFNIRADFRAENAPLTVDFAGQQLPATLHWQLVDQLYSCDDHELGCRLINGSATIKLWAPLAEKVDLLVFARDDQTKLLIQQGMQRNEKGIWFLTLRPDDLPAKDNLAGYYYQFEVTNPGLQARRVLDPYARSMAPVTMAASGNSAGSSGDFTGKAAIVAPELSGPELSHPVIQGYKKREDAVIYEVHIRDFTSDPILEGELKHRWGSFRAFIEKLPYIKSLGVTHVQLLPVMAWYFGDETAMGARELEYRARNNNYNWGYDPQNYFSPDGAFSEKPEDPGQRIAELKELIDAVHKAGMGVVLDVVYTHMAKASFLNDIVPDYYFFKDSQGNFLGDFGNNLATNRKMAARLLIDSVKYWFSEYKIDGMRFDMMGDATSAAIQAAYEAAAAINPDALFIGEGWRTFKGHLEDPALKGKGADQDWMDKTDSVGVFSDEFRNELKSGFGCEGEPMFLTGGARNISKLFKNIKAQPTNTPADAPGDMVQYIEAHDNLPLYDVIAQSIKKDPEIPENDQEIHRRIRLGNAILLTSQGTVMLHAGQEYGRSKQWLAESTPEQKFHFFTDASGKPFKHPYFIHDSYDSSDAVNKFDWAKVTDPEKFSTNIQTINYTRGLIALRRSSEAFRLGSKKLIEDNVKLLQFKEAQDEDLLIVFSCKSPEEKQTWYVFANADQQQRTITHALNLENAEVMVDSQRAGTEPIKTPVGCTISGSTITIDPLSVIIVRKQS
jgi:secreted pullulanase